MSTSLTGEARKFTQLSTVKDVGYGLAGLYGAHLVANMIPFGAKTGWSQVGKLALSTAGIAWAGDKFLGAQAGSALFTGGAILVGLEVVGNLSGGKYGAIPTDAAPAQKALPGAAASGAPMLPAGSVLTGVNNSTGNNLASSYAAQGY